MNAASAADEIIGHFITLLAQTAGTLLGPTEVSALVPEITVRTGISRLWRGRVENRIDCSDRIQAQTKMGILIHGLERTLGAELTESWLEDIYTKLEKAYTPALANEHILPLVPERYLEKYRLRLLSAEELATMLEHERERDRELARANVQLREIDRRKSEFISVVAHQLRTPLAGFKWALDLLVKGQAGPVTPEQKQILDKSYEGNEHMISLVEEMLRADRVEGGHFDITPASVDIVQVVKNIISDITPLAEKKQITLVFEHGAETIPHIMLDPDKIRAVFQNLIENAISYSPAGSAVTVVVRKEEKNVLITVSDQGIGIPKGEEGEIFSRLYRAKNARLARPDGSGLGLYIAKNIVTLHGGTIRFESVENKGTTFFVTLPL
ncbi:MAG TPA: HAMP domain-containing sensor histidine kinase [Candidatus Paceibacterota bacterium]|nr:HAMP domain-containing sensor histidine kinase [Candidatus Paceibacterota bacterium]